MRADVHCFYADSPDDTKGLNEALLQGQLLAEDIVAIMGKTEGNGGGNDFTRSLATSAFRRLLSQRLSLTEDAVEARIILSFSGGSEGVITPHYLVFTSQGKVRSEPLPSKRLALACGRTRKFSAAEVGTRVMALETEAVVRTLLSELRVAPEDVHLVHIKGALPLNSSGSDGRCTMAYARASTALGVAMALGEVCGDDIKDETIGARLDLYSSVAQVSAKPGLLASEIVLFANSAYWEGSCEINHAVMRDIIDRQSVEALLRRLGVVAPEGTRGDQGARIRAIFAKSDADPSHRIRGHRHTMWTDEDFSDMRYSRCVLGGVLAMLTACTTIYVSTRAEHMGPSGGGPVAMIVSHD